MSCCACSTVCRSNPAAGVSGRRAESGTSHARANPLREREWRRRGRPACDASSSASTTAAATSATSAATSAAAAARTDPRRPARSSAPASFFFGVGGAHLTSRRHHVVGGAALAEDRPLGETSEKLAQQLEPASSSAFDADAHPGEDVSSNVVSGANINAATTTTTSDAPLETRNGASGSTTPSPSSSSTPGPPHHTQLAPSSSSRAWDSGMSQSQIDSVLPTGVDGQYIRGVALSNAKGNAEPYWLSPLGVRRHLPLLIFLPGLDGSGLLIWSQLEELSPFYDVRCLAIPPTDRSTYDQLAARVNDEIASERAARGDLRGMPVTVAGESFSGPLALMIGVEYPAAADYLVVINSGTAFRHHPLLFYGSQLVPAVPDQLFDFSSYALAPFLSDWRRLIDDNRALITPPFSVNLVPKSTVVHRLNCVANFTQTGEQLARITAQTLFVASGKDRIFPSVAEARRLMAHVPRCKLHVAAQSGHAVLLEEETCLAQIISDARYLPPKPVAAAYAAMGRPEAPDAQERASRLARLTAEVSRRAEAASAAATQLTETPDDEGALCRAKEAIAELMEATARMNELKEEVSSASSSSAAAGGGGGGGAHQSIRGGGVERGDELKEGGEGGGGLEPNGNGSGVDAGAARRGAEYDLEPQTFIPAATKNEKNAALAAANRAAVSEADPKAGRRLSKPRKLNTEESLTGDVAGAAIERMLEEMPVYRLWNWLCRPEFFGLDNIPDEKPLIFVGNHTMYGIYDMPLMIYELRKRKGVTLRGLAHPLHYASAFGDLLARYGAVKATPRNCFKLIEAGESVLLYPGGAREVAKRRGEANTLIWKEETDFVRLAMRHGCTIVPFAALGVDDAFNIALDSTDIMASPAGESIRKMFTDMGAGPETGIDPADAIPPVAMGMLPFVPSPSRLYFSFGEPIRTDQYSKEQLEDKELCSELYKRVKQQVEGNIEFLTVKREQDPISAFLPRAVLNLAEFWDGN